MKVYIALAETKDFSEVMKVFNDENEALLFCQRMNNLKNQYQYRYIEKEVDTNFFRLMKSISINIFYFFVLAMVLQFLIIMFGENQ